MIPMNIAFYIHRVGEWTLLMMGECVFSLVIVDVPDETRDFFFTFYCSVLAIVFLSYLHFQSQPQVCSHALRRSKDAGVLWGLQMPIYSFALVCLGAAFTFFLDYYATREEAHRLLAGGDDGSDSSQEHQRSAYLFSFSLAVIFACMDATTVLHIGYEEVSNRLRKDGKSNVMGIMILAVRLAVIPFTATLGFWETDPARLSMIGLLCVLVQLVLRKFGNVYLIHTDEEEHPTKDGKATPGVSSPRRMRESVLMASAFVNMSQLQLDALEAEVSEELENEEIVMQS